MEALGIQEQQKKQQFYNNPPNSDLNTLNYNNKNKQIFYNENNQNIFHGELQENSFIKVNNNNNNGENKSKKYFKFVHKQQQQQNINPLNRNQRSYENINNLLLAENQKQEDILIQSNNNFNNNNETVKPLSNISTDSTSNTLKNFQSRVRSRYKLFKDKLKSSIGTIDPSQQEQQEQFFNNSNPNLLIENKNNKTAMQNNNIKMNNYLPASISTTNTNSVPLSGLYNFDNNNNNNNSNNNLRFFVNEDLNYPFVIHTDFKNRKQSASPNNRIKTSNERRAQNNEKFMQMNALVNNKGLNDHQSQKHANQSPYFYTKDHRNYSSSPPAGAQKFRNMKSNSKEDLFVTGNYVSGKLYNQNQSHNQNIFDLLNDNPEDTQTITNRFNSLNIPSDLESHVSSNKKPLHISTVYAQALDDLNNSFGLHNASTLSTRTPDENSSSNKASKQLSKLLKHIKKKLKGGSSSKVEKLQGSNSQQSVCELPQNLLVTNNLNPNETIMSNPSLSTKTKLNLETSLSSTQTTSAIAQAHTVEQTKKQNRDIITKLYKAYHKKFDKHKSNKTINQREGKLPPTTLVTELFVGNNFDNTNNRDNDQHLQAQRRQDPEYVRKRIKTFRSDPSLYLNEAQLEANRFDAEMTSLLKATKDKFGQDNPIATKTIDNNNYLNNKVNEMQKKAKINNSLEHQYRVNDFFLSTAQQQQKLNEIAQSYLKFQRVNHPNNNHSFNIFENDVQSSLKPSSLNISKISNNETHDQLLDYSQQDENETTSQLNRTKSFTNNLTPSSKKRVSFHEQVIKTDVESGNSTLVPILYTVKERQYMPHAKRSINNEIENNSNFKLNNRTPADTPVSRNIYDVSNTHETNNRAFITKAESVYPQALINDNMNRKIEIININKAYNKSLENANIYPNFYSYDSKKIEQPVEQRF